MPVMTMPRLPAARFAVSYQPCDATGSRTASILVILDWALQASQRAEGRLTVNGTAFTFRIDPGESEGFVVLPIPAGSHTVIGAISYYPANGTAPLYSDWAIHALTFTVPGCAEPACPSLSVTHAVATDCEDDRQRHVTFTLNFAPMLPEGTQMEIIISEPGMGDIVKPVTTARATATITVREKLTAGTHTLTLSVRYLDGMTGCPSAAATVGPFAIPDCACPDAAIKAAGAMECLSDTHPLVTQTFTVALNRNVRIDQITWAVRDVNRALLNQKSGPAMRSYQYEFEAPGTYEVFVTVQVPGCAPATTSRTVVVRACSCPVVSGTLEAFVHPARPTTYSFNVPVSNPDNAAITYSWDFGDGSKLTTTVPNATHAYARHGTYTVTVALASEGCGTAVLALDLATHISPPSIPKVEECAWYDITCNACALTGALLAVFVTAFIVATAYGSGIQAVWAAIQAIGSGTLTLADIAVTLGGLTSFGLFTKYLIECGPCKFGVALLTGVGAAAVIVAGMSLLATVPPFIPAAVALGVAIGAAGLLAAKEC